MRKVPNGSVNTRARSITSAPLDARKNSKKLLKNMPKNKKDDYLQIKGDSWTIRLSSQKSHQRTGKTCQEQRWEIKIKNELKKL
jgi:hypothetical protein